jgi:hypothetical protein
VGEWIRPISELGALALSTDDRQYADGAEPRPLDILTFHLLHAAPRGPYVETHLTDPEHFCRLVDRASWDQALNAVDRSLRPLWAPGASSAFGLNEGSLRLIEVADLRIDRTTDGVRGVFNHNGLPYALPLYDDAFTRVHAEENVGAALLCVGLREGHDGRSRKGIDAVITRADA